MKKILFILSIAFLSSCEHKRGEIRQYPQDFIEINGKVYKLVKVVPQDGANGIWIMYPKDTLDKIPTVLNYGVQSGKSTRNQTVIKID